MPQHLSTPHAVSEFMLDRTGRALLNSDAQLFETCMALPQHMETFEGSIYCETIAHLHTIFYSVVDHMHRCNVTDLARHCIAAEYRGPDTIEATHETRILSGTRVIQPAYPVFSILQRIEGRWKITYSMYAITDAPVHSQALISVPPPERAIS